MYNEDFAVKTALLELYKLTVKYHDEVSKDTSTIPTGVARTHTIETKIRQYCFSSLSLSLHTLHTPQRPRKLRKSGTVDARPEGVVWEGESPLSSKPLPQLWRSGCHPGKFFFENLGANMHNFG